MVTLKQIATKVGVSSATVSRVLNFDTTLSITEKKRQAIIETAEALNYATPRARNRATQKGLTKIALMHFLSPDEELTDPYYVALRLGIERRCKALKIEVVKVYHSEDLPESNLIKSASGVIAIGRLKRVEIAWLRENAQHVVFADYTPPNEEFDSVHYDLHIAMRKLLEAMSGVGYEKIAFVGWGDLKSAPDERGYEARARAFIEWQEQRGTFDPNLFKLGENSEVSGYELTQELLDQATIPDIIITCNDNLAVGAYRMVHERNMKIPDDIALASFNDISVAQFMHPPLTTVRLPAEEIGEAAVEMMLERVSGRKLTKNTRLATEIKWRKSTKKPQKTG